MTVATYASFVGITLAAILLIMRACFFLFVIKADPMKAVLPPVGMLMLNRGKQRDTQKRIAELS